jgi:PHP family Zn ribbon phosphoesterase
VRITPERCELLALLGQIIPQHLQLLSFCGIVRDELHIEIREGGGGELGAIKAQQQGVDRRAQNEHRLL